MATTFQLFKKGTTTQIAAQVTYNADTDTAKLDATNNLRRGVAYKAVVSTGERTLLANGSTRTAPPAASSRCGGSLE